MDQPNLYCPECGTKLEGNRCPQHPELLHGVGEHPILREFAATASHSRPRSLWIAVGLALLVLGVAIEWILVARTSARLTEDFAVLNRRFTELATQIGDQSQATRGLNDRIAALESELANEPDLASIAKQARRSVFTVEAIDSLGASTSLGSGFVVEADVSRSILLTNYHVIAEAVSTGGRIKIRRQDLTFAASVIATNEDVDLAAIEVAEGLPALTVDADRPKVGDSVVVVGSPLGLEQTVTNGIVSAFREGYIQFSAAISPGSSGGALVNPDGRVVGVVVGKFVGPEIEGLSFAIPIGKACQSVISC
jgi:putative serine protease PepD